MKSFSKNQIVFGVLSIALFFAVSSTYAEAPTLQLVETIFEDEAEETRILLVGDIMLGRVVENIIERNQFSYVMDGVNDLLEEFDVVVGNFEGIVAEKHIKTPPFGYKFSIREEYLEDLSTSGFTMLSLANNHAYDYGSNSLFKTRVFCYEFDLLCLGDPLKLNEFSYSTQEINGKTFGYLFLHTLFSKPDFEEIKNVISNLNAQVDFLITYIHWGQEYELIHNESQETLAHMLIDSGADTVIGHHPHVVQDIEIYNGKPIFYSLGNFIFDQYFDDEVQKGLGVQIILDNQDINYKVIGFTTEHSVAQPRLMSHREAAALFERISSQIIKTDGPYGELSL